MNELNQSKKTQLAEAIRSLPKCDLATLPTPLERCDRLTKHLAGPEIWIKRDDLTGLAMGGNKTRMFEYALGDAVQRGIDTVVAGAAVQSNFCRQLAASCAKLGLECHLILRKVRGERDQEIQGGLLLDLMLGAQVTLVEDRGTWEEHGEKVRQKARELEEAGRRVLVSRVGDESGLGLYSAAYVAATLELIDQADSHGMQIDQLWLCSSDTTQSGIAYALKYMGSPIRLVGLPALAEPVTSGWTFEECFSQTANACGQALGLPACVEPEDITSITDYVAPGYSILNDKAREAMQMLGSLEGILLDPVYTSKAMAGLIDHIREGKIPKEQKVVFLHTGGLPALFAYSDALGLESRLGT
jgi:L-cysteate sulfo-lyase